VGGKWFSAIPGKIAAGGSPTPAAVKREVEDTSPIESAEKARKNRWLLGQWREGNKGTQGVAYRKNIKKRQGV